MIIDPIKKRRSFRAYKSDSVSDELINEIIKAAQFAPTAYNKKAIEFVVVKDQKIKDVLAEIVQQPYVKEAPVLIVPVADNNNCVLPVQDLSIASDHIFLQATALGLGTVWKNVSVEMAEKVKEALEIPADFQLINIIPLGFPGEEKSDHSDEEFSAKKIHAEKW